MQKWLQVSLLLCTFGFFREMRPSEPFVLEYLSGDWHNITTEQVTREIFPFGTYAVLAQLVLVFLVTDILRYKPIIVLSAIAGIILFAILLWTKTVWELQIGQIFYGTFMASEVAYYTYIYAKVDKSHYQVVTGHTRAAILCGKFMGGVLAQVLHSTETLDYRELHFISLGTQIISLFIAFALPSVGKSLYFYTVKENPSDLPALEMQEVVSTDSAKKTNPELSWRNAFRLLVHHTVSAYKKPIVVQWSCWWSLATCGQLQVISYAQFLWKEIDENHESHYNGVVEATVTLLGAASAMLAGLTNSNRPKNRHKWILTICSLLMGAFLIVSAETNIVLVAYVMYVLFGVLYFYVITVASSTVAENLPDDSFGLIFGFNTLMALLLQTILTIVVVTDNGFGLGAREQYLVYGAYFLVLAFLYFSTVAFRFVCRRKAEN